MRRPGDQWERQGDDSFLARALEALNENGLIPCGIDLRDAGGMDSIVVLLFHDRHKVLRAEKVVHSIGPLEIDTDKEAVFVIRCVDLPRVIEMSAQNELPIAHLYGVGDDFVAVGMYGYDGLRGEMLARKLLPKRVYSRVPS